MVRTWIRRAAIAVLPAAALAAFALAVPASAATTHTAALAAAPPCAAGYAPITNWNTGASIEGNGVNHPVFLASTGNCFKPLNKFTYSSETGYEYQNGDGHCLWVNGITVELGGACVAGHVNEEIYSDAYIPGEGWTLANVGTASGLIRPSPCSNGSEVQVLNSSSCGAWSST